MTRIKVYKTLTEKFKGINKKMNNVFLLKMLLLILGFIPLYLYSVLINSVIVNENLNLLVYVIAAYIVICIFTSLLVFIERDYTNKIKINLRLNLKEQLITKLSEIESEKYNNGDMRKKIEEDSSFASDFLFSHILDFVFSLLYAFVLFVILIVIDWKIALISFIFVPISMFVINYYGRKNYKTTQLLREQEAEYEDFLHTSLQNWKDIKLNNLENKQLDILNSHYGKIKKIYFLNQLFVHIGISFAFITKNFITQLFIYFIGGFFLLLGYTEITGFLLFINFYAQFFTLVEKICNIIMNYKKDIVHVENVIEIINKEVDNLPYKKICGSNIVVQDLKFEYNSNSAFKLDGINFSVQKGEHLAIVGKSGSGKSTITNLLMGAFKVLEGKILIGNTDISTVNAESISDKISIVTQDIVLFNMTIRDNLLVSKNSVDECELIQACKKAGIYDFIQSLDDKFDTILGEKGIKVSGGQKQRLALARAFLQDRDIIIFDEGTSALDSEIESNLIKEINNFSSEKTIISVAHRLSSIINCDKVLLLDQGKMVAIDTHANLLNKNELYNKIFKSQYI